MRARFVSVDPTESSVCDFMGHAFPLGEWVDVSREVYDKVATMPPFEVDGDSDGEPDQDGPAMKAELDRLGIKYHHKAGPAKLAELLAAHRPEGAAVDEAVEE